jgi:hypothetical protein
MSDTFKNEKHQLTRADAVKMINAAPARSEFAVGLTVTAPLVQGGTQMFHPYVDITRTEAARLALRMFSDPDEQAGARVPMWSVSGDHENQSTYWIG